MTGTVVHMAGTGTPPSRPSGTPTSLDRTLQLVGDRWSILIIRAALRGVRRFDDFCADLGGEVIVVGSPKQRSLADGVTPAQGWAWMAETFRPSIKRAEERGVTICLEHLNTRDGSHPMKGHPGYQGDDIDYVANICRRVGSPRVKLLFDIYHVQIMDGDVVRTMRDNLKYISHIHVAGVPSRTEIDETNELNFKFIAKAIADSGYNGFVAHEWRPAMGNDPIKSLEKCFEIMNV